MMRRSRSKAGCVRAGIRVEDKLFQLFFTTKPSGERTGLGLSISWDIVTQQHGGMIEVDNKVSEFTEFRIRLPRRQHVAPQLDQRRLLKGLQVPIATTRSLPLASGLQGRIPQIRV